MKQKAVLQNLFLRPLFKTKFLLFRCYKKKVKVLNQVPFPIAFDFKVHVFFISYVSTSITKPRPCVVFHFDVIAQFGNISISKRPWNRKRMEHFIKLRKIYSIGFIFRHTTVQYWYKKQFNAGDPRVNHFHCLIHVHCLVKATIKIYRPIGKRIVDAQFGENYNVKILMFRTLNCEYKGYNKINFKI